MSRWFFFKTEKLYLASFSFKILKRSNLFRRVYPKRDAANNGQHRKRFGTRGPRERDLTKATSERLAAAVSSSHTLALCNMKESVAGYIRRVLYLYNVTLCSGGACSRSLSTTRTMDARDARGRKHTIIVCGALPSIYLSLSLSLSVGRSLVLRSCICAWQLRFSTRSQLFATLQWLDARAASVRISACDFLRR